MLFRPRKVAGSVSEMCLRRRQRRQEVTGRLGHPQGSESPDGIDCPQWCAAGLLHQLESPQGIQKFPDISGHTFSHQEEHPGHTQGTSRQWATESRCLPTRQTIPMGPEHSGSEHEPWFVPPSGPSTIHWLHTCPAGPQRIRARDAH